MSYLIGMDEAGYGPNLGPLVIAASVWRIDDRPPRAAAGGGVADLHELLADAVSRGPGSRGVGRAGRGGGADERLAIADSKLLYTSGDGLGALERGVLSVLELLGTRPRDWREAWETLAGSSGATRQQDPWYEGFNRPLPVSCDAADCRFAAQRLKSVAAEASVRCCSLVGRAVFPAEFNALSAQLDSKGAALTQRTLELLRETLEPLAGQRVYVVCDKHGGRNFYAPLLQQHVTEELVKVHGEATAESVYRWGPSASRVEVRFRAKAEGFLPAALASMTAKYLRELALLAFNDFWCARVPRLRATAGYPLDARRFKAEIATHQAALAIDDRRLWRNR